MSVSNLSVLTLSMYSLSPTGNPGLLRARLTFFIAVLPGPSYCISQSRSAEALEEGMHTWMNEDSDMLERMSLWI